MKKLQAQLKAVAKELNKLSKQIENVAAQVEKQGKAKPAPKKKAAKKAAPSKKAKKSTILDTVYDVVRRSQNGATIAQLKKKTGLAQPQINSVLSILRKRGIVTKIGKVYKKNGVGGGGG